MMLQDKVCLGVGAASLRGIGYATAELFARHGAKLAVVDVAMDDTATAAILGAGPVADAFFVAQRLPNLFRSLFAEGALTAREKSLIALGVAFAVQCPYCIDAYTRDTLEKGCDPEQLTEVAHVAAAIKGGAALVHGVQMRNVVGKVGM